VERGAIADAAVRRLWLRSFENVQTTAAGLTATTMLQGGTPPAGCGVAAARFTRSSDSLVMTVAADDIIAVSAT
jgi:hypothetical protein